MAAQNEIDGLARLYGEPQRVSFRFLVRSPGFREWVQRLTRRRGEIVLIVPRAQDRVLLHTKPHYPQGIYRLPTGGIHFGEAADAAARREAYEEIGFKPQTLRFVGLLTNTFIVQDDPLVYPSYVFETEAFTLKPAPTDLSEPISGFQDAGAAALDAVAMQLRGLTGGWQEWGSFRAAPHAWLAKHWTH